MTPEECDTLCRGLHALQQKNMGEVRPMDRDEVITALSHEGKSQRAIARELGVSQPAIRKRLLKLGLLNPPIPSPAVPPTSGDTSPAPMLSVDDNRPAVPLELPEPSRENSAGQPATQNAPAKVSPTPTRTATAAPGPLGYGPCSPAPALCGFCHAPFQPNRGGQLYCCNCCGHRANGSPVNYDHEPDCPVITADNDTWGVATVVKGTSTK